MKACEIRGDLNPFKGNIKCEGGISDISAFSHMTKTQGEKEIGGQEACPFSLESCCDTIVSEREDQLKGICPFTLESLDMPSMSYCRAVR